MGTGILPGGVSPPLWKQLLETGTGADSSVSPAPQKQHEGVEDYLPGGELSAAKPGIAAPPLFGPGYLKELPCCVHCAVGWLWEAVKRIAPPFLLPEPQQANADSGPVPLQVKSSRLLKDAKRCHVY